MNVDVLEISAENGNVIDPQYNAVLRATLEECRRNNMPKETIDRSIKRAVGIFLASDLIEGKNDVD